jgi:hypothetical protein
MKQESLRVCVHICFGLIGHHQMYSQMHNEPNIFFVKILYIRYLVKRVGCNPYYCTFNG